MSDTGTPKIAISDRQIEEIVAMIEMAEVLGKSMNLTTAQVMRIFLKVGLQIAKDPNGPLATLMTKGIM